MAVTRFYYKERMIHMTVNEAIALAVQAVGELVPRENLVNWLWEIENTVISEIAQTHKGRIWDSTAINKETAGDRELFAPDPFSRLYTAYLVMKSDLFLRDISGYINSVSVFSEAYTSFSDWYNRTYMPLNNTKITV